MVVLLYSCYGNDHDTLCSLHNFCVIRPAGGTMDRTLLCKALTPYLSSPRPPPGQTGESARVRRSLLCSKVPGAGESARVRPSFLNQRPARTRPFLVRLSPRGYLGRPWNLEYESAVHRDEPEQAISTEAAASARLSRPHCARDRGRMAHARNDPACI